MTLFNDNFRIESNRLKNWNYYGAGRYFITVCTKNLENYFGDIINGQLHLTPLGIEVQNQWLATPHFRPRMNITFDEFQVMPNHFHGIIEIGRNEYNRKFSPGSLSNNIDSLKPGGDQISNGFDDCSGTELGHSGGSAVEFCHSDRSGVETQGLASLPQNDDSKQISQIPNSHHSTFGPQSNNLGSVMRGFKSSVTMFARQHKTLFDWQRSYHDIIIRDERAWKNIRRYIRNNVKNWKGDRFKK